MRTLRRCSASARRRYDPLLVGGTAGEVKLALHFTSPIAATLTATVSGLAEESLTAADGSVLGNQTCESRETTYQTRAEQTLPHGPIKIQN